ncbi:MAG: hypothetical protein OQK73_00065 [Gammaproteobacteria bacterium]|nr:hypothetical protein [Gammaproteobacteria bacterium]
MACEPKVDDWYKDVIEQCIFKVVAIDNDEETIEIQYFEGEIEELDFDSWKDMALVTAPEQEDMRGAFDDLDSDDMGDTDRPMHPQNWSDPLNELE